LAGAQLFDEIIRQSVALFWFGLRDVRVFKKIFFSQAVIQKPIVDFPAFLETGLAEKIAVCDHTTRVFLYEAAQNFEVFSRSQDQNLKIKNLYTVYSG
jgi:hypothetical protein